MAVSVRACVTSMLEGYDCQKSSMRNEVRLMLSPTVTVPSCCMPSMVPIHGDWLVARLRMLYP